MKLTFSKHQRINIMNTIRKLASFAFGLALSGALYAHSESFKPDFVQSLVDPYLSVQRALAGDDLAAAKEGATAYLDALKQAPKDEEAQEEVADLRQPAEELLAASSIGYARKAFLGLSQEMKTIVKHVGISSHEPLYVARCPMAFGGKGGIWISDQKAIANPYYGASMLTCGGVQEQISGEKGESGSEHGHMDDDHDSMEHDGHMKMDHDSMSGDMKHEH